MIAFTAFFMGEGSAIISRNNGSYAVALSLRLRDDDEVVIHDIIEKVGGRFHRNRPDNPNAGSQISWQVRQIAHVRDLCQHMLNLSVLPAKKVRDLEMVLDFCQWRMNLGYHLTPDERQEAERRFNALKELRQYSFVKLHTGPVISADL